MSTRMKNLTEQREFAKQTKKKRSLRTNIIYSLLRGKLDNEKKKKKTCRRPKQKMASNLLRILVAWQENIFFYVIRI